MDKLTRQTMAKALLRSAIERDIDHRDVLDGSNNDAAKAVIENRAHRTPPHEMASPEAGRLMGRAYQQNQGGIDRLAGVMVRREELRQGDDSGPMAQYFSGTPDGEPRLDRPTNVDRNMLAKALMQMHSQGGGTDGEMEQIDNLSKHYKVKPPFGR